MNSSNKFRDLNVSFATMASVRVKISSSLVKTLTLSTSSFVITLSNLLPTLITSNTFITFINIDVMIL